MTTYSILVVDDEPVICELLKMSLEKAGHRIVSLPSGSEVVEVLQKNAFDLLIIDILMPHKDGIEVIVELRKKHVPIRILAMSGGGRYSLKMSHDYLNMAKRLGANAVLTKPFTPPDLSLAIAAAFAN